MGPVLHTLYQDCDLGSWSCSRSFRAVQPALRLSTTSSMWSWNVQSWTPSTSYGKCTKSRSVPVSLWILIWIRLWKMKLPRMSTSNELLFPELCIRGGQISTEGNRNPANVLDHHSQCRKKDQSTGWVAAGGSMLAGEDMSSAHQASNLCYQLNPGILICPNCSFKIYVIFCFRCVQTIFLNTKSCNTDLTLFPLLCLYWLFKSRPHLLRFFNLIANMWTKAARSSKPIFGLE